MEAKRANLFMLLMATRFGHGLGNRSVKMNARDMSGAVGIRRMLGVKQVLALVPFSRATLYNEMTAGRFPKAREIAPRRIAWYEDDVKEWQEGLRTSLAAPTA